MAGRARTVEETDADAPRRWLDQRGDRPAGRSHPGPTVVLALAVMILAGGLLIGRVKVRFPEFKGQGERRAPERIALSEVRVLRIALEQFRRDCGRYPTLRVISLF